MSSIGRVHLAPRSAQKHMTASLGYAFLYTLHGTCLSNRKWKVYTIVDSFVSTLKDIFTGSHVAKSPTVQSLIRYLKLALCVDCTSCSAVTRNVTTTSSVTFISFCAVIWQGRKMQVSRCTRRQCLEALAALCPYTIISVSTGWLHKSPTTCCSQSMTWSDLFDTKEHFLSIMHRVAI